MPVLTVAIAVAIGIVLLLRKARFHYERLPKIPYASGAQFGEVAIIVPERNERVLQSFPEDMVVLVDDHAEDRAAEIARRTPEAEWLLFVDARTQYARVFLPSLMQYAVDENLETVGVLLRQEATTLSEKILLPYGLALRFTGEKALPANAPCLLVKRQVYLQMGTASGVRARMTRAEHMGSIRPHGFEPIRFSLPSVLAALLLASWLPMLALLILSGYTRQAMIFGLLPSVILFPWYRGPATLFAPLAIYLYLWNALRTRTSA